MPCPFADVFGKPNEGFHAQRLFGLAQNDVIGTIALAAITSSIFDVKFHKSLIGWIVAGEALHISCGVDTALLRSLKPSNTKNISQDQRTED